MKFFDRRAIEDTSPRVFIGRCIFINRSGQEQVAAHWYAEANHGGRTHVAPLKTASLSVAIHRAHQFADKLRAAGDAAPTRRAIDVAELARQYLAMQANRNRAPKTIAAYEFTLACFVAWTKRRFNGPAESFTEQLLAAIDARFTRAETRQDKTDERWSEIREDLAKIKAKLGVVDSPKP